VPRVAPALLESCSVMLRRHGESFIARTIAVS
jgi:hypothetical protein